MTIDFHKLFSTEYLVTIDPSRLHPTDKGLLVLGVALSVIGLVARVAGRWSAHPHGRQQLRRVSAWALTIGLLELLWFGLRYERALYLGSHLAAFLVLLAGLIWLVFLLKYRFGQYRRDVIQWQKDQVKQKYLRNS